MVSENVRKTFKLCPCAWYPARKKKPERVTQMTWLKSKCKTTLFSRTIDFDQPLPRFWPKEKCPKSLLVLLGRNAKTIIFDTKCCLFLDHFHSVSFWHTQKSLAAYTYQFLDRLGHLGTLWLPKPFLQKSDKGQVFYWSSQTSTRFSRLVVTTHHAQKASKLPYFRLFHPDTQILSTLLPYTDLEPPSTDPVPPSTK